MGTQSVSEKLDEIGVLIIMLHPADSAGFELVFDVLQDLNKILSTHAEHEPIKKALAELLANKDSPDKESQIKELSNFVSNSQAFLSGTGSQVFDSPKADSGWGDDLSSHADHSLVIEFIEKHTSLLDDFEARLMEGVHSEWKENSNESKELQAGLKAYLHNIKGDAGSVGLIGIERATHKVEELVLANFPMAITDELLAYREWVLSVVKAYTDGLAPTEKSHDFLTRIIKRKAAAPVETSVHAVPATKNETVVPKENSTRSIVTPSVERNPVDKKSLEPYQISGDTELLSEFLVEAEDHLNFVEELLLTKQTAYTSDDLNAVFRAVHSIKGGSAYFNLKEILKMSHSAENLMDKARNGHVAFNSALKAIVLKYIDLLRTMMESIRQALEKDNTLTPNGNVQAFMAELEDTLISVSLLENIDSVTAMEEIASHSVAKSVPAEPETPVLVKETTTVANAPTKDEPSLTNSELSATTDEKSGGSVKTDKVELKTFVKVDTDRLDLLIEYIGEMVISSSTLIRSVRDLLGDHENVVSNSNQLERISREIQEIGMSMRLIPIKGLFQKMSRVVWDTAKKLNKEVRFEMSGEETELDRTVIERLADPLMHMVRNAVDHGVEISEERAKLGKSKAGEVTLSAYQAGGNIYIQIKDDGKGLDPEKLVAHARKKGVIGSDEKLSKEEAFMLIFAPGFSTATVVTDVSGRGVGMDVVRRNIESMRGRISIQSEVGRGSLFTIELPLTLAITEGLETQVGNERYIIPTLSVVEFLRPRPEMIMHTLDKGETLRFRGSFLPIFRLSHLYDVQSIYGKITDCIIVVVENGGKRVALLVDDVLGKLSVVIKSLGAVFEDTKGISGCAVMPDGSVGLILDVGSLMELAQSGCYKFGGTKSSDGTGAEIKSSDTASATIQ